MTNWMTLEKLQPGSIFRTHAGILAVKSEYYYPNAQSQCVLLASGEYAHFPEKNDVEVQEIPLALIKAAPDLLAACELGNYSGNGLTLLEAAARIVGPLAPVVTMELRRKSETELEAIAKAQGEQASD